MAKLHKRKVLILPEILEPDSWYLVSNGTNVNMYITDSSKNLKRLGNTEMINELIEDKLSILPNTENRVFNETPIGILDGVNVIFTSLDNFIPETVTIFLNGMFQRVVIDFHTVGNNTIILTSSPSSTENILINYTKL